MKKLIGIALALIVMTSLIGCSEANNSNGADRKEIASNEEPNNDNITKEKSNQTNGKDTKKYEKISISMDNGKELSLPCRLADIMGLGFVMSDDHRTNGLKAIENSEIVFLDGGIGALFTTTVATDTKDDFENAVVTSIQLSVYNDSEIGINGIKIDSTKKEVLDTFGNRYNSHSIIYDEEAASYDLGIVTVTFEFDEEENFEEMEDRAKVDDILIEVNQNDILPIPTYIKSFEINGKQLNFDTNLERLVNTIDDGKENIKLGEGAWDAEETLNELQDMGKEETNKHMAAVFPNGDSFSLVLENTTNKKMKCKDAKVSDFSFSKEELLTTPIFFTLSNGERISFDGQTSKQFLLDFEDAGETDLGTSEITMRDAVYLYSFTFDENNSLIKLSIR